MSTRSLLTFAICLAFCLALASMAMATTIKDGTLTYSAGHYLYPQPLKVGYDVFGYNYQAHMFNGSYFNVYSGGDGLPPYEGDDAAYLHANPGAVNHWAWPYRGVDLKMKWNDQWISNEDNTGDGKLDRHFGYPSYIGSGAWETNHQSGFDVIAVNGKNKQIHWSYFVKIVAAPSDAYTLDDVWYGSDDVEIGPVIWGSFAVIQRVYNDPAALAHGKQYVSPAGPGFGQYGPE